MRRTAKYILPFFAGFLLTSISAYSKPADPILYNRNGLLISHARATYKGRVLYDAARDLKALFMREGKTLDGVEYYYTPLSLVGPYFSYERDYYDDGGTGDSSRAPSNEIVVETVDIRSGQKVDVLELIDERSLVAALKKDCWVREHALYPEQLEGCRTFGEFLRVDGLDDDMGNRFSANSYAFVGTERKAGMVGLRLSREDYMGYSHNQLLQLGLWVRPKREVRKLFMLPANFYLKDLAGM